MEIKKIVKEWLEAGNAFDTDRYLKMWHNDAVLNDPYVGKQFKGRAGVKQYFEAYFIGYRTTTTLVKLTILGDNAAHLDVVFTGEFPEGKINGIFDVTFKNGKIVTAEANLV